VARVRSAQQPISSSLAAAIKNVITLAQQEQIDAKTISEHIIALERISTTRTSALHLPLTVFSDARVGALEATVFYLRDHCKLDFSTISTHLDRPHTTLRHSYAVARKKLDGVLAVGPSTHTIPVVLFQDRSTSVQRLLVRYCHDELKLSFSAIAKAIARDPRTVWTAYHAKRGGAA